MRGLALTKLALAVYMRNFLVSRGHRWYWRQLRRTRGGASRRRSWTWRKYIIPTVRMAECRCVSGVEPRRQPHLRYRQRWTRLSRQCASCRHTWRTKATSKRCSIIWTVSEYIAFRKKTEPLYFFLISSLVAHRSKQFWQAAAEGNMSQSCTKMAKI